MQLGKLQLQVSSVPYERLLRDLLVLQCFDALKRGGILLTDSKPRTLATITRRDRNFFESGVPHPSEGYNWSPCRSHRK